MAKIYEFEGIKEISILDYFPSKLHKRMNLTPEQQIVSQFIIDFKNGYKPASILAAKIVSQIITENFNLNEDTIVFIPIPASTKDDTKKRYGLFSYLVSQNCHVIDGQHLAKNWRETDKKHLSVNHTINGDEHKRWFIDYNKTKNIKAVIFDDVATTGETAACFIQRLEKGGAKVIGEIFLASSFHLKSHLWQNKNNSIKK